MYHRLDFVNDLFHFSTVQNMKQTPKLAYHFIEYLGVNTCRRYYTDLKDVVIRIQILRLILTLTTVTSKSHQMFIKVAQK